VTRLYFGYGSNLHRADFEAWCRARGHDPGLVTLQQAAFLPDHEPVFHYHSPVRAGGALDVHPRPGSAVAGALFEVEEGGWALLDAKEGVAQGRYRAVEVDVLTADGRVVTARTYRVVPDRREGHVPPTDAYLERVCEGLAALDLPDAPVRAAARGERPPAFPGAVFVYGTLMRGQVRGALMQAHAPVRVHPGSVRGRLVSLGWYPGLCPPEHPDERVHGEIFHFEGAEALLAELDAYEDFLGYRDPRSLYHRVLLDVATAHGSELAWVYLYVGSAEGAALLPTGRWAERPSTDDGGEDS